MTDVFVNLQSPAYKALPFVFDIVLRVAGNIVVVVPPLVNLMKDQIDKLGIPALSLGDIDIDEEDAKGVEKGHFPNVHGSPEARLKSEQWGKLLSSEIYRTELCAIAVDELIKQW